MLHGFFFGLGFMYSIAFSFFILVLVSKAIKRRKVNAPVSIWTKYYVKLVHDQLFEEAGQVRGLIDHGPRDKQGYVLTPACYDVKIKKNLHIDDESGFIEVKKAYKIKKIKHQS